MMGPEETLKGFHDLIDKSLTGQEQAVAHGAVDFLFGVALFVINIASDIKRIADVMENDPEEPEMPQEPE